MHEKSCIFFVYSNEGENYGKNFKTRLGFFCITRQCQWTQHCRQCSKTSTATKNDSVTSSNSVKSNNTASSATDKAKSDDLVTHGQSNAGKAKTVETANKAVTGKTVKTASTTGIIAGTALIATMATLSIIRKKMPLSKDRFFHIKVKIKHDNLQFTI